MKKVFKLPFILLALLVVVSCGEQQVDFEQLEKRGDKYYLAGEEDPFSGEAIVDYQTGEKARVTAFKDGLRHGPDISYHLGGQKKSEVTWEEGKRQGVETAWYESGAKKTEVTFVDDRMDGKALMWFEDGTLAREGMYDAGARTGVWTWYTMEGDTARTQTYEQQKI